MSQPGDSEERFCEQSEGYSAEDAIDQDKKLFRKVDRIARREVLRPQRKYKDTGRITPVCGYRKFTVIILLLI